MAISSINQQAGGSVSELKGSAVSKFNASDAKKGSLTQQRELSKEEKKEVDDLKQRDREVRTHESTHIGAAGGYAKGGATYSYQTGPDGKRYAVGGEVQIDTSPVKGDPQATILKMQVIKQAALAPASPSSQDRAVAAAAAQNESQARQELAQKKSATGSQGDEDVASEAGATPSQKTASYNIEGTSQKGFISNLTSAIDLIA
jgi:hypothetical protein